ncbi:MAG: type VI secretion system baseplate subunit TssF [Leptothrix sp. (in: b-proteobacteria)]
MDPGLLRLYNQELAHLRSVGAEFAQQFPKIAARLTLDGIEVADPYVERLLEGCAFLAARVQLKIDAEYPLFVQHLLETLYPNALSPVPSMTVLRLQPDLADPNLAKGAVVPRGAAVLSPVRGQDTRCEFRTAHEVRLWPLELSAVRYSAHTADLPLAQLPVARQARSSLRLRLRLHGGLRFSDLPLDALALHLSAPDEVSYRLHELLHGAAIGTWVPLPSAASGSTSPVQSQWRHADDSLRAPGYADNEALLPDTLRGFSGYRLMQEYAALPQRFLFVELAQLRARLARIASDEAEIVILFSRSEPTLEALVDADSLALYCTPAINLFPRRLDRIQTGTGADAAPAWEHHVVPDRTRPLDFEVYSLQSVTGHGVGRVAEQTFLPLYTSVHTEGAQHAAYYTVRREPRLLSPRQQQQGARSSYIGTEVYLSLVDARQAPYAEDLRQLSLSALVTNRDLPLLLPGGGQREARNPTGNNGGNGSTSTGWALEAPGPIKAVHCLRGPTAPIVRLPRGELGWQLISQLTQNHLSIVDEEPQRAAAALRSLLLLHGLPQDASWRKQIEGIQSVSARPVTRRLPFPGQLSFGSGVQIDLDVDELAFQGGSAFLLGSVLEHYFARQATLNSFTLTRLHSASRGTLMQWPARIGARRIL